MQQTRQLAAIMFTDIVGYSGLMGRDEAGAMKLLDLSRKMQQNLVAVHNGRWIKELGDGVIIVFNSVLNAVNCAMDIQKQARRIESLSLKIAIHSGEILMTTNDVFGDSVNLTSRMEQLGEKDTIILSGTALSAINNIASIQTAYLGDFNLKNIQLPVSLYAVLGPGLTIPNLSADQPDIQASEEDRTKMSDRDISLVSEVKAMVKENLTNHQLSVTYLCQMLGVSRPQLYRKLQAETGFAPSDFIREIRLQRAAGLLKDPGNNVSETAYQSGFNNLSYFSKCFQERFNCTPSEYQKRNKSAFKAVQLLDKFIGREAELKEIVDILTKTRLLTLCGTGGTGKTRLAMEIISRIGPSLRDGATMVQLAPVAESQQVLPKIAQILKIPQDPLIQTLDSINAAIGDREMLLFLDNFEHVLGASSEVKSMLLACPHLTILVTSRAFLNIRGEHEYVVSQLPTPQIDVNYNLVDLADIASVALFLDRAKSVKPGFTLNEENKKAIAAICHHLEGLPLALELAAARIKLFSPEALLKRLRSNLDILSSNAADQPNRHKTLRNTIDWSYNLLSPEEQTLFRRLAVFKGGCTLQAAEEVCFQGYKDNLEIIENMAGLVDKSLLQREYRTDGEPRFYLLETIKTYAQERLNRSQEKKSIRQAYVQHHLQRREAEEEHLTGPEQGKYCDIIEEELDNLRAILKLAEEEENAELGLKFSTTFWRFWILRSMMREGTNWLRRMLEIPTEDRKTILRCRALNAYGVMYGTTNNIFDAAPIFEEALLIAQDINYQAGIAETLNHQAWMYHSANDFKESERCSYAALQIHQRLENQRGISVAHQNIGQSATYRGQLNKGLEHHQKAGSIRKRIGDLRGYAYNLINEARLLLHLGFYDKAQRKTGEAQTILETIADHQLLAWCLTIKANACYQNAELIDAITFLNDAQPLWSKAGNKWGGATNMIIHASTLFAANDKEAAIKLLGAVAEDFQDGLIGAHHLWFNHIQSLVKLETEELGSLYQQVKKNLKEVVEKEVYLFLSDYLELMSEILIRRKNSKGALILFSTSEQFRQQLQIPVPPVRLAFYDQTLKELKDSFDNNQFDTFWARGQETTPEECCDLI